MTTTDPIKEALERYLAICDMLQAFSGMFSVAFSDMQFKIQDQLGTMFKG